MRASTALIAVGVVLLVVPAPGTYALGGVAVLLGVLLRWLGG
jgi:hypothetical protein